MHEWHIKHEQKKRAGKLFHRRLSLPEKKVAEKAHQQRVSYFHPLINRKELETEFLQAQKMEAIGRVSAGVAHDFNNILTVIAGYTELLKARLTDQKSEVADLEEIGKAVERGKNLTNRLSTFSRRERVSLPVVSNLNEAIRNMKGMLGQFTPDNIELKIETSDSALPINMSSGQLEQVFANMIVNACDAMPCGGQIQIETKSVVLDGKILFPHQRNRAQGQYALLTLKDAGMGMSEEVQQHLFEPFFTTKEKGRGTGLGLATSYGLIKQAGGFIQVQSELNKGTTFQIYLPINNTAT